MATTYEDSLSSHYLTSSISSLSSARSQSSWIARTYRQAAQLFLTRRLYEALATIEPIISRESSSSDAIAYGQNGAPASAPVAAASRTTRVKVWSFYLTLLNSIIELGVEEGKLVFGSTRWKALAAKAREGTAWDEVVDLGYSGDEGAVDGEVVINLTTLLLTHMASQKLNQNKLETYLSSTSNPTYNVTQHIENSQNNIRSSAKTVTDTDTPRHLNTRLKLLELYTLHVLPQNAEWDYAREFITMSEVLDEERRDAFLNALQMLKEEKEHDAVREKELRRRQEHEMQQRREEEERRRRDEARQEEEQKKKREADEKKQSSSSSNSSTRGKTPPASTSIPSSAPSQNKSKAKSLPPPPRSRGPGKKPPSPPSSSSSPSIIQRASSLVSLMQNTILNARHSVMTNPMAMLRFLLFLLAFTMAFARRDVRESVKRTVDESWQRVRRTIGMGVKVSYI